jgi:hypothetical protein
MKQSRAASGASKSNADQGVSASLAQVPGEIMDTDVQELIRTQAYLRAEKRGFAPGGALDDWLAAEQDWFPQEKRN